jgi:hypothetical protein
MMISHLHGICALPAKIIGIVVDKLNLGCAAAKMHVMVSKPCSPNAIQLLKVVHHMKLVLDLLKLRCIHTFGVILMRRR